MNILIASLPITAEPKEWARIATTGEWKGYPGGVRKLDADDLASVVAFHAAVNAGKSDVVIDYDHATLKAIAGQLDPKMADASGWVEALEIRLPHSEMGNGKSEIGNPSELWIKPRWTPLAKAKIEAGERRYLSPVILFDYPHPVTGKPARAMLHSVALTNTPFFRHLGGVSSLAASDAAALLSEPPHTKPSAFIRFAPNFLAHGAKPIIVGEPPYPNEHSCRVEDPDQYETCRTKEIAAGISIIVCKKKGKDEWETQAYRFDADKFTAEQARAWLDEHKISGRFEPARKEKEVETKKLAAMLGIPEDTAEAEVEKQLAAAIEKSKAAPPLIGADVADLLGVEVSADLEAVKAAVEKLKAIPSPSGRGEGEGSSVALVAIATALGIADPEKAELDAILKRVGELGGRVEGTQAEALVGEAVKARKIAPGQAAWWIEQATRDLDGTKAIIASMPPIIGAAIKPPEDEDVELTPEELAVGKQLGLSREDLIKEKKRKLTGK